MSATSAIFDSLLVSRIHGEFALGNFSGLVKLQDFGSMHGTFLNGKKLKTGEFVKLEDGDQVSLGRDTSSEALLQPRKVLFGVAGNDPSESCRFFVRIKNLRRISSYSEVIDLDPIPSIPSGSTLPSSSQPATFSVPDASSDSGSDYEVDPVIRIAPANPVADTLGSDTFGSLELDVDLAIEDDYAAHPSPRRIGSPSPLSSLSPARSIAESLASQPSIFEDAKLAPGYFFDSEDEMSEVFGENDLGDYPCDDDLNVNSQNDEIDGTNDTPNTTPDDTERQMTQTAMDGKASETVSHSISAQDNFPSKRGSDLVDNAFGSPIYSPESPTIAFAKLHKDDQIGSNNTNPAVATVSGDQWKSSKWTDSTKLLNTLDKEAGETAMEQCLYVDDDNLSHTKSVQSRRCEVYDDSDLRPWFHQPSHTTESGQSAHTHGYSLATMEPPAYRPKSPGSSVSLSYPRRPFATDQSKVAISNLVESASTPTHLKAYWGREAGNAPTCRKRKIEDLLNPEPQQVTKAVTLQESIQSVERSKRSGVSDLKSILLNSCDAGNIGMQHRSDLERTPRTVSWAQDTQSIENPRDDAGVEAARTVTAADLIEEIAAGSSSEVSSVPFTTKEVSTRTVQDASRLESSTPFTASVPKATLSAIKQVHPADDIGEQEHARPSKIVRLSLNPRIIPDRDLSPEAPYTRDIGRPYDHDIEVERKRKETARKVQELREKIEARKKERLSEARGTARRHSEERKAVLKRVAQTAGTLALGALIGGVGVISALVALPDSYF